MLPCALARGMKRRTMFLGFSPIGNLAKANKEEGLYPRLKSQGNRKNCGR